MHIWNRYSMDDMPHLVLILFGVRLLSDGPLVGIVYVCVCVVLVHED